MWTDEIDTLAAGLNHVYYHPPLFLHLAALWSHIGTNDFRLRLLPAIIGVLSIYFIYRLGTRIAGQRIGIWSALFLSFAPPAVYYSREFRMYCMVLLVSIISWDRFFAWMEKGTTFRAIVYAIVTASILYTHHYGFFMVCAQGLAGFFFRPPRKSIQRLAIGLGLVVLLYLPFLHQMLFLSSRFMKSSFWAKPITLETNIYILRFITGHFEPGFYHAIILGTLVTALVIAGLSRTQNTRLAIFFVFGFIISLTLSYIASMILPSSTFVARYVIYLLAPFYIAAACGLEKIRYPVVKYSLACLILGLQFWSITYQYRNIFVGALPREVRPREDFKSPTTYIADHFRPGDVIGATCESGVYPAWYYLTYRQGFPNPYLIDVDGIYASHLTMKYNLDQYIKQSYPYLDATEISTLVTRYQRFWLFESQWEATTNPNDTYYAQRIRLREWLLQRYPMIDEQSYFGAEIRLFDLTQPL